MKKVTLLFLSVLFTTIGYAQVPTSDAPTPSGTGKDIISIFSGEFTDITGVTLNPNWGQAGFGAADTNFDRGSGDISLKYPNFNYQGIDFDGNRQNLSGYEKVHLDIWTNSTNVNFFLINASGEISQSITASTGSWQSLDLNLSDFTGLDLTTIRQLKFDGGNGTTSEIYVDNIYFWKTAAAAGTDATLSDLKIDGTTVSNFAPASENYDVGLPQGGSTPLITLASTTDASATAIITQASSVPGDATVVVTAADGTTMKTYTVSFAFTIPNMEAPTPTIPQANAVAIFSDEYTAPGNPNYNPNWGQSGFGTANTNYDINSDGDSNAVLYYSNFNYQGMQFDAINASTFDFIHMDIWTPADPANTTIQVSPINNGTGATETLVTIPYTKGQWTSVVLPKSMFTGMTWDSVFQFKIAANGSGSAVPVDILVDNIFFSKSPTYIWIGSVDDNWSNAANWSDNEVPNALSNVEINLGSATFPIISSTTGAVTNNLTIDAGASLTIQNGGTLLVNGVSSGSVTYNVSVTDTDWHFISSPVVGQDYGDTWISNNGIASGTVDTNNRGIATYDNTTNADGTWSYFSTGSAATPFNNGQGYSLKRTASGDYSFLGTIATTGSRGLTVANAGTANENKWNLVGNPFPSYINVASLLTNNEVAIDAARDAVYVWDGSTYNAMTTGFIHPGQGFFVNASSAAAGAFTTSKNILSHQTGVTFFRDNTTKLTLNVFNNETVKSTEITYLDNKTRGLDRRYDLGTFNGVASNFSVYTHLVAESTGINFMKQALPKDYENLIVPIGINAVAGSELSLNINKASFPNDIRIYIEDRVLSKFTDVTDENTNYKITLDDNLNGIGRFYIHTSRRALSTDDINPILESVSIYKTKSSSLRIDGLSQGKATVKLFNILGKEVFSTKFESSSVQEIALPNLNTGLYIVHLETENGTLNRKIALD